MITRRIPSIETERTSPRDGSSTGPANRPRTGWRRLQRIPCRIHRADRDASGSYNERITHQVTQRTATRMTSITASRPVYSEATSSEAPNSMPGSRNDGAQVMQVGISTARNLVGFMPIMPATDGIMGRNGPMNRSGYYAFCAVGVKKAGAAFHHRRVSGKRPDIQQVSAKMAAQVKTDEIAQERANAGNYPDRHQIQHSETDQRAHAKQDHDAGQQDSDQNQRFEEGDQEYDADAPTRVCIEPSQTAPVSNLFPSSFSFKRHVKPDILAGRPL